MIFAILVNGRCKESIIDIEFFPEEIMSGSLAVLANFASYLSAIVFSPI